MKTHYAIITIAILLILRSNLAAQIPLKSASIKISGEIELPLVKSMSHNKSGYDNLIGIDNQNAYLFLHDQDAHIIMRQSLSLNTTDNKSVEIILNKNEVFQFITWGNSSINVFYVKKKTPRIHSM